MLVYINYWATAEAKTHLIDVTLFRAILIAYIVGNLRRQY